VHERDTQHATVAQPGHLWQAQVQGIATLNSQESRVLSGGARGVVLTRSRHDLKVLGVEGDKFTMPGSTKPANHNQDWNMATGRTFPIPNAEIYRQQRELGKTCPSLYDLRNLFQVNVEEGRHLWAMVYLLHRYFGRDGRDEADALLERRSGNPDKPRILEAFNQPCDDWLNFFCFTMFTDRDGKYQLSALAESGFEPLARTCQFMLTEEAHHMFVGDTGLNRVVKRTAQLMKQGDVRELGGIPLDIIQKHVNFWFSYSLDLFGGEISSNSADFFAAGLKGRYKEQEQYQDHIVAEQNFTMKVVENGQLKDREVALRNALNEVLRGEYVRDCEKGLARWNKTLADEGIGERLSLPNTRFHRHVGEYATHQFDIEGNLITAAELERRKSEWLPTMADREYVRSLMHPVTEPGKIANWIAPPATGIKGKPFEFEYVRL